MKKIVLTGNSCRCNQGTVPYLLKGSSNLKVAGKSAVDENDKFGLMFGICQILTAQAQGTPTPCRYASVEAWKSTSKSLTISGKKIVLEDSKLSCTIGGTISVVNSSQTVKVKG